MVTDAWLNFSTTTAITTQKMPARSSTHQYEATFSATGPSPKSGPPGISPFGGPPGPEAACSRGSPWAKRSRAFSRSDRDEVLFGVYDIALPFCSIVCA